MNTEIKKRTFANTAAALAVFDAGAEERLAAWGNVQVDADVRACEAEDSAALAKVQEVFHQDTADINSRDSCRHVDLQFMRRMVQG